MRGLKSTYQSHGTLNLLAALEVGTGQVKGKITEYKKRADFQNFLDGVIAEQPTDKEIHVILDNYCTHKKNDEWLGKYKGRLIVLLDMKKLLDLGVPQKNLAEGLTGPQANRRATAAK